jgi:WD40 repeat protein
MAVASTAIFFALATASLAGERGAAGDLYVSGYSSNNVVQFDGQTGALVGEFINASAGGLSGMNAAGIAFGPNGNIFVCSTYGHSVREYDGNTGAFIREAVPGTRDQASGYLEWPRCILFMPDGRLLVADFGDDSIQAYDSTTFQWLGTFAIGGPAQGGLDGPTGMILGPNGNVFVSGGPGSNNAPGHIVEYHATTGRLVRVIASGISSTTQGLEFGANGSMWTLNYWGDYATQSTGRILQLNPADGSVLMTASVVKPRNVLIAPDGNVLVAHQGEILRFNGATGAAMGRFAASSMLSNAEGMTFKPAPPVALPIPTVTGVSASQLDACAGRVNISVTGSNLDPAKTRVMLSAAGEPNLVGAIKSATAGSAEVEFNLGAGIAGGTRSIAVVNPDGQSSTLPDAIDVTPCREATETNLFVLGFRHRQKTRDGLLEYDAESGNVIDFVIEDPTTGDDLRLSRGFLFAYDGNVLITSKVPFPGSVLQYDGVTGQKVGTWITTGAGGMKRPIKLLYGPNGNLFILHYDPDPNSSTYGLDGVLEFDGIAGTFVREVVPLGACGLENSWDFRFGPGGNIYITIESTVVSGMGEIFVFDPESGDCVGGGALSVERLSICEGLKALEFTPRNDALVLPWSAGSECYRITEHDPHTAGLLSTPIASPVGPVSMAVAATFGPGGKLVVAGMYDPIVRYDLAAGQAVGSFSALTNASGYGIIGEIKFNPLAGDGNADWAVDLVDFAAMQRCFTGESAVPADPNCLKLDADRDGDVDAADGAALARKLTGPK